MGNSRRKAALLLVTLGSEVSAEVFRHLSPTEVDCLASEIACLDCIDPDEKYETLMEFCSRMDTDRIPDIGEQGPVEGSRVEADPGRVLELVGSEHPQTIALVLSRMDPEGAAFVLRNLPAAMQPDVARRIATIDRAAPETLRTVERVLEARLGHSVDVYRSGSESGGESGAESLVRILDRVGSQAGTRIMGELETGHPVTARAIRDASRGMTSRGIAARRSVVSGPGQG